MPYYHLYEFNHATIGPARAAADLTKLYFQSPFNPLSQTHLGRQIAAACELFERTTRRYGKPAFDLPTTFVDGVEVAVDEEVVWRRPFCELLHFRRDLPEGRRPDPKVLMVAPMSGHYATLLRGTVETMLPDHDIYITDWVDARMVPLLEGRFDLDDYVDYLIEMIHVLGPDTHVMGVCQPSVPVLAAVSLMESRADPIVPRSMILMGGPIDTRRNPTVVNAVAEQRGIDWFRRHVIMKVPFPHPGVYRDVYPGFLQLGGFMSMNLDRHVGAHKEFYEHLVSGDGDSAEKHRDFYDEYLAVMDLTAEFYLQTVETVFIRHALPTGTMVHRNELVDPGAIRRTALMTVEGEKDDITGGGQTEAALDLCVSIPPERKLHYTQPSVGHYGVFNGSRFRAEIYPRIAAFIRAAERPLQTAAPVPTATAAAAVPTATPPAATPPAATPPAATDPAAAALEPSVASPEPSASIPEASVASPETSAAVPEPVVAVSPPPQPVLPLDDSPVRDDLKTITGIGPKLEQQLNREGIFLFHQLADLDDAQIDDLDRRLNTRGRIRRDDWVGQARRRLATA